jgi:hypothetical protein
LVAAPLARAASKEAADKEEEVGCRRIGIREGEKERRGRGWPAARAASKVVAGREEEEEQRSNAVVRLNVRTLAAP